jgi:hypothetical protein
MRTEDPLQRPVDAAIEPIPTRVQGVQRDELNVTGHRPATHEPCGERRLPRAAAAVDEHNRVGGGDGANILLDQCRGALECGRDRIVTS